MLPERTNIGVGYFQNINWSIGKRPSRRPMRRWEVNIIVDLKELGIITRNWIDSAQDRDYWRTP